MMKTINNWYVITGSPCSGKTTLITLFKKKGFKVIYEAARIIIDQEIKKGKTIKEIRKNELSFQKKVLRLKIKIEKNLKKNKIIFFERGIPDSVTYYKLCGVDNDSFLKESVTKSFYRKVFLLKKLVYQKDYARIENKKQINQIEKDLFFTYKNLGFNIIKVPIMTVTKRSEYILKHL